MKLTKQNKIDIAAVVCTLVALLVIGAYVLGASTN